MRNFAQRGNVLIIILVIIIVIITAAAGFWIWKINKDNRALKNSLEASADVLPEKKAVSPAEDKNGPYYHAVYSATSTDGIIWKKDDKMVFDHASVPGAIIKNGVIYMYFVDANEKEYQLSVSQSNDLGKTFTNKQKVEIQDQGKNSAADPHPELVGEKIRLYFLGDFSTLPQQGVNAQFKMYSAESSDGISFDKPKLAYTGKNMDTDPDVFQTDKDWRMLISNGQNLILTVSDDKGLTFTKDKNFSWSKGGVPDTIKIDNQYNTYYCGKGIEYATGAETGELTPAGIAISQSSSSQIVCDPSIIKLPDETYLMFYKVQEIEGNQNQQISPIPIP